MKRSRHRWVGLSLFCISLTLLAVELPTTSAAKATSLFFPKTTTTTSTSTTAAPEEASEDGTDADTTAEGDDANTTSKFTGNPQVDYLYDPNLPRELNGYDMSDYPFFSTAPKPETLDFKCDGLHDGFYASIPTKCQVYHHCLYGTRYDFLCANYTAFDQKTFICQFVNVVDCKNSANYFHRNDALYKATTTTTPVPPSTTTTTTTTQRPLRPGRRRPAYRYDYDDDDYYYARDDYDYEDRRRPRPRRPGKKKRPVVDDYEDDRSYDRRPRPRDEEPEDDYEERRPYDRRPAKRPAYPERRPYDDEEDRRPVSRRPRPRPRDEENEQRYRPDDVERPRLGQRDQKREDRPKRPRPKDEYGPRDEARPRDEIRPKDEVRPRDEIRPRDESRVEDEVRPRDETRPRDEIRPREPIRPREKIRPRDQIRPRDEVEPRDEIRPRDGIRPRDEIRPRAEIRPRDEIKPRDEPSRERPERRPVREEANIEEEEEEVVEQKTVRPARPREDRISEGRRYRGGTPFKTRDNRPYTKSDFVQRPYDDRNEEKREVPGAPESSAATALVKPNGSGIFGKPRMPPKIKRPVPINEKDKYDYVPITTTKAPPKVDDDEYYDYEEDETSRPSSSGKSSTIQQRPKLEPVVKERFKPTRPHYSGKGRKTKIPIDYEEEVYDEPVKSQKYTYNQRAKEERIKPTPVPADDEYYDYEEEKIEKERLRAGEDITSKIKDLRPNVKVVKRPFLPSRGGSPYLPRGLQPVAGRDVSAPLNTTPKPTTTSPKPTTTPTPTTTTSTTTTTTPSTTTLTSTTTTTTEKPTTTVTTKKPTTEELTDEYDEEEYYDEEDIDYDKNNEKETTTAVAITQPSTTRATTTVAPTTEQPITEQPITHEQKAKNLASKVLRVYNDNYEAIRDKLESTLSPGDYIKPYLATATPLVADNPYRPSEYKKDIKPKPEISKPYTATGKPLLPENISIKQNLADSIENDYDVRLNEALTPTLPVSRVPSGFVIPSDRDYSFSRFRNNLQPAEPQYAASDISSFQVRKRPQVSGVSIRTPSSYYLQPQRLVFQDDPSHRYPRQLFYRSVDLY